MIASFSWTSLFSGRSTLLVAAAMGGVALALRVFGLEAIPLDPREAALAVGTLSREPGTMLSWGPLMTHLTALMFWLFGPSDATARLVPALAGGATALLPLLLVPTLGRPGPIACGLFLAVAPISVDMSRRADPAAVTVLLMFLATTAAIRLGHDDPHWSDWVFAATLGLLLAHEPVTVVALASLGIATLIGAVALGRPVLDQAAALGQRLRTQPGAWLLGGGLLVIAATGGLTDPRGAGYVLGDLWGGLAGTLAPSAPSFRILLAFAAYAWPLVLLAATEMVLAARSRDLVGIILGVWTVVLGILAVNRGEQHLSFVALVMVPLTLLAGQAVSRWLSPVRLIGPDGWTAIVLSLMVIGAALIVTADSVGAGRSPSRIALVGSATMALLLGEAWRRTGARGNLRGALSVLAVGLFAVWSLSSIIRAGLLTSPPGAEPLRSEQTSPVFRAVFDELSISASNTPGLQLDVRIDPAGVGRWYGRAIPEVARRGAAPVSAIVVQTVEDLRSPAALPGPRRVPWRVRSILKTDDLHPLGIARWLASRNGLLVGQPDDVVVTRPQGG